MSLTSRLIGRMMHLPPAETHQIVVTRNLKIPMPDGVVLLADQTVYHDPEHPSRIVLPVLLHQNIPH